MSKLCVIVGAGQGVSMGVARRFGKEGYNLALMGRNENALNGYATELRQTLGEQTEVLSIAADASNFDGLRSAFEKLRTQAGDPEVLVYNAALLQQDSFTSLTPEQVIRAFEVNVVGAMVAAQAVIPAMRQNKKGTILFTGGGLALSPAPMYASLSLGKAGVRTLAYALGAELEPEGVHVATVTIAGTVQAGTFFDPDNIAEAYWKLHSQPTGQFEREIVYKQ
jgi:short-subunit dehydrogenase